VAARQKGEEERDRRGSGEPARTSSLGVQIALVLAFCVLAAIGVVTVLVPELSDDGSSEEGSSEEGSGGEGSSAEGESAGGAREREDRAASESRRPTPSAPSGGPSP
jgi:hypothetical protein